MPQQKSSWLTDFFKRFKSKPKPRVITENHFSVNIPPGVDKEQLMRHTTDELLRKFRDGSLLNKLVAPAPIGRFVLETEAVMQGEEHDAKLFVLAQGYTVDEFGNKSPVKFENHHAPNCGCPLHQRPHDPCSVVYLRLLVNVEKIEFLNPEQRNKDKHK